MFFFLYIILFLLLFIGVRLKTYERPELHYVAVVVNEFLLILPVLWGAIFILSYLYCVGVKGFLTKYSWVGRRVRYGAFV